VNGVLVVDDSYNANPVSVAAALEWFGGHPVTGRRAVALGDMLELGDESPAYHREAGARAADLAPDLAVFVGSESRAAFEEYQRRRGDQPDARWMSDSDEAARALREWARPGDAVLVKGSRGVGMERVVRALAEEESGDAV
jgi:UDP-N-acetylmuramoyl-tripeptide--D-alanyl-D-alanine ligase